MTNPNPCLVNVLVDNDYVRIGPNQSADVPEKAVASLLKSGALVAAGEDAGDDGQKTAGDMRAGELKVELDKLGVSYAGNASTETLRGLYEAALAGQAGKGQ
ncbi:hypothetical protein [Paracandidimonas lactea]|uniref:hypothetical protein n=1 Tax=Paracandidimonas lactea TaxID=2895524 RepID=UPI001F3E88D5|nr:hypothetical protein [Paracandidimonas lactea]